MTHKEALDNSTRALDHRFPCEHELTHDGPDWRLRLCELWTCPKCRITLSIDPTGVIREQWPTAMRGPTC